MKKKCSHLFIVTLFIASIFGLIYFQFRLPEPLTLDAPENQFSAGRAIEQLEPMVVKPHPAGSTALAAVREKLISELQELGFQVEVQSTTGTLTRYQVAGEVDNILARMPGTDNSGALMLMAHYDSVPQGPGAGDNGAGVVTILETIRALGMELPLRNDLVIVFTDVEEYGILGAQAFTAQHPWMDDVSVVLNIEGTLQGSVVLVETGPQNGWFVKNFRDASPHAMGYSWLYDLFGIMPNLTDFMPFREAGLAGGNLFSFNGGSQYHTPRDTISNMDPRSLQQHGEQTLALVQHFGKADLSNPHAGDAIYFNLFRSWMVVYPAVWAPPLAGFTSLIIIYYLGWTGAQQKLAVKKVLVGLLGTLAVLISGPGLAMVLWSITQKIFPQYSLYFPAHTYNDSWYAIAFAALAAGLSILIIKLILRKASWQEFLAGILITLGVINLGISFYSPGFSYLFTWPLIFTCLSSLILIKKEISPQWLREVVIGSLFLVCCLFWTPVGLILYWSSGLDFLPVITLTALFPVLLVVPLAPFIQKPAGNYYAALCGLTFLLAFILGGFTSGFNENRPMPLRVQYFYDVSKSEAFWINPAGYRSSWQDQFTKQGIEEVSWKEIFPAFQSTILRSPAAVYDLEPPWITLLEDSTSGQVRTLRLLIKPTRKSDQLLLSLPPETTVLDVSVNDQTWMDSSEAVPDWTTLYFIAPSEAGLETTLITALPGPDQLLVTERSVGLETIPGIQISLRPQDVMTLGDYVFTSQSINLR